MSSPILYHSSSSSDLPAALQNQHDEPNAPVIKPLEDLKRIPDFSLPNAFQKGEESRISTQNYEIQVISNEQNEEEAGTRAQQVPSGSSESQVPVKKFSIRNHLKNARASRS